MVRFISLKSLYTFIWVCVSVFPGQSLAQPYPGIAGHSVDPPFDISGLWEEVSYLTLDPSLSTSRQKWIQGPYDTLQLELVEQTQDGAFITREYRGLLTRARLYRVSSDCVRTFDNSQSAVRVIFQPFEVEWSQTWQVFQGGLYLFSESATATYVGSFMPFYYREPLEMRRSYTPSAAVLANVENDPYWDLEGGSPNGFKATLEATDSHPWVGTICAPEDEFFTVTAASPSDANNGNLGVLQRRSRVAGELGVRGTIEGVVESAQPTVTEIPKLVERGTVNLYALEAPVRAQDAGESDEDYADYLEEVKDSRTLVRSTRIEDKLFKFENVPVFRRSNGGAGAYTNIPYTLEVVNAETDEPALDENDEVIPGEFTPLIFAPATFNNVAVFQPNILIELDNLEVLGLKRRILGEVLEAGPVRYPAAEAAAIAFLDQLESGSGPTPEQLEGIRRGILAERIVRDGARFSRDLSKEMLGSFGTLLADLYGDLTNYSSQSVVESRRRAEAARERARQTDTSRASSFNLDPSNPPATQSLQNLSPGDASIYAERIRKVISGLKPLVVDGLTSQGMASDDAELAATVLQEALNLVLLAIERDSVAGATQGLQKQGIQLLVRGAGLPIVYDNSSGLPSYTNLTDEALAYAATEMAGWDQANPSQFFADRDNYNQYIAQIGDRAAEVQVRLAYYGAFASSLDAASDIYSVGADFVPAARVAEKLATIGKYVANTAAFVDPMVYVFLTAPGIVESGSYAAFGQTPPVASSLIDQKFQRSVMIGDYTLNTPDYDAFRGAISSLRGLLSGGDVPAMILSVGDSDLGAFASAEASYADEVHLYIAQLNALDPTSSLNFNSAHLAAMLSEIVFDGQSALVAFRDALQSLILAVLNDRYSSPQDPRYLARLEELLGYLDEVEQSADQLEGAYNPLSLTIQNVEFLPLVLADSIAVTSRSTGASVISQTGEVFDLQVEVSNPGTVAVDSVEVMLEIASPEESMVVMGPNPQTISLNAGETETVTFVLEYEGDLTAEMVALHVLLEENGMFPGSFYAEGTGAFLLVDPDVSDSDHDGLPNAWELEFGLDPNTASAETDSDGDGLPARLEFNFGTRPNVTDSDGDGLGDNDELTGKTQGVLTDPLNPDTDGDGVNDSLDGAPLNPFETSTTTAGEPAVGLSKTQVTLNADALVATVEVENLGSGDLEWIATSGAPWMVKVLSGSGPSNGGFLTLGLSLDADLIDSVAAVIPVEVRDTSGAEKDRQIVYVVVNQPSDDDAEAPSLSYQPASESLIIRQTATLRGNYRAYRSTDFTQWSPIPGAIETGVEPGDKVEILLEVDADTMVPAFYSLRWEAP